MPAGPLSAEFHHHQQQVGIDQQVIEMRAVEKSHVA
jgi:hypothetical protein